MPATREMPHLSPNSKAHIQHLSPLGRRRECPSETFGPLRATQRLKLARDDGRGGDTLADAFPRDALSYESPPLIFFVVFAVPMCVLWT